MKSVYRTSYSCAKALLKGLLLFGVNCSAAFAIPAFTWDPSNATPPLSGAGSAFTADTILMTHYLHSVVQPTGSFQEELLFDIDSFQLAGQTVATPGLNSTPGLSDSYDLYFIITANGQLAPATTFDTLSISLIGDPGNNNGAITASAAGITFANTGPTGVADDILLGTGTLVSATMTFDPITGVRRAHFVESFQPVPGQAAFFVSPTAFPIRLEQFLTTPPSAFSAVPGPEGTTIITVNGGTSVANFTPEPASLILIVTGLLCLRLTGRRAAGVTDDMRDRQFRVI